MGELTFSRFDENKSYAFLWYRKKNIRLVDLFLKERL